MKSKRSQLLPFAVAPLLLALEPLGDDVSFHPKEGSSLGKHFEVAIDLELEELSLMVDGQDMSEMGFPQDLALSVEGALDITDEFVKLAERKPLELVRSYDEISMNSEFTAAGNTQSDDGGELEKLEGVKVKFTWDDEAKDYTVAYHESSGDDDLLDKLHIDLDLRALLPEESVDTGDKWEVPAEGLMTLLSWGMSAKAGMPDDPEAVEILEKLLPQFENMGKDVKTTCTYKGSREDEGVRVGVVEIAVEGKPTVDLAGFISEMIAKQGEQQGITIDANVKKAQVVLEIDGKGELLWNLAKGTVQACSLDSQLTVGFELDVSVDAEGTTQDIEGAISFSGSLDWSAEAK